MLNQGFILFVLLELEDTDTVQEYDEYSNRSYILDNESVQASQFVASGTFIGFFDGFIDSPEPAYEYCHQHPAQRQEYIRCEEVIGVQDIPWAD